MTNSTAACHDRTPPIGLFALKYNDEFLVADAMGDIAGDGDGLFLNDTRLLSRFSLDIGGTTPSLLSSGVSQDNVFFHANVTNRPLPQLGGSVTPEGVIHIERARFLWEGRMYESLTLTHYGARRVPAPVSFRFAADFADIFEVRGHVRSSRGRLLAPSVDENAVTLAYEGLDGLLRKSIVAFSQKPDALSGDAASFTLALGERSQLSLYLEVGTEREANPARARFRSAAACARMAMRRKRTRGAVTKCSRGPFQTWLEKSRADLALLTTDMRTGPYPFAGIPWFSTPFGRDGIVTALQLLWLDPSLARGVLQFLAASQSHTTSAFDDAAPGKILHETRAGEMAALGEVPFRHYYGGVDTTPLFVVLAGAYARRTGDMALIDRLWSSLEAAMRWVVGAGDSNGDGFVDYARATRTGLVNQGWKDSADSIFHADGSMAEPPIALVEVQGYAYAALRAMAWLTDHRDEHAQAHEWRWRAKQLRAAVEKRFWLPDLKFYAIALDGSGKPCKVRASNAGHLLYTKLPSAQRATWVVEQLLSSAFNNGWGLRTLAQGQTRFNPMSYHNGSVWPHDTALCAAGMAEYGYRVAAGQLLSELFGAATYFGTRLPELYCGFRRKTGEPPVGYPVACLPQAWSSGATFMLLQACLGLSIDGSNGLLRIDRPELPAEVDRLVLNKLEVDGACVDIAFERTGSRVTATPLGPVPSSVEILVRA
ncbi:MAG TPA: amylo-alpha-1,6-glucosidase [Casimicrobiaceae bacterium]|nr:amylo-alpha-1,6-glucosidase [Casimicrobiaceae bacterium]